MGERKGVNKYYPPDWDPSKGSINEFVGQHPLRDRARKLGQGILIIRFEMPYNIWCDGCNNHIGMGVRYNAEKSKTGMYYTTPIYKFRMKCHLCDNHFEIQTDPKNHDYVILEGARRKEQRWDPKENEQIVTEDKATQKKMATDAMFKLEHVSDDVQKSKKTVASLSSLEERRDDWKDDYMLNKLARKKFREEKKSLKKLTDSDTELLQRSSLDIPLEKEREEDIRLAGLIKYSAVETYDEKQAQKRKEIESRPLFEPAEKISKTEPTSPESSKLDIIKKHLKLARNSAQTNPFDRTKMNTLGTAGTTISKEALGIRRKSLPKYESSTVKDVNEKAENSSSFVNVTDTTDTENRLSNSTLLPESVGNVDTSQGSGERLEGKQLRETPRFISDCKCDDSRRHSVEAKRCRNHNLPWAEKPDLTETCDKTDIKPATGENEKKDHDSGKHVISESKNNHSVNEPGDEPKPTMALGLVCSYSDSDSDT